MLALPDGVHYYLYQGHADMRKTFCGLEGLVKNELQARPTSGDVFIFISRRRTQIKLLQWQKDGFAIYHKRLESGTFELPVSKNVQGGLQVTADSLLLILKGIRLSSVTYRKRFSGVEM